MCEVIKAPKINTRPAPFGNNEVVKVVPTDRLATAPHPSIAPFQGEEAVLIHPSPGPERDGDVLMCRHPDENGDGEWEVVPWPHGDEAVLVPVGSELKLVIANPGIEFVGMV